MKSFKFALFYYDVSKINTSTYFPDSCGRVLANNQKLYLNSFPPSAAYMRQGTGSALVQAMACCLFGTKPLPEPMLIFRQLDPCEQTSVKFQSKYFFFFHENTYENVVCEMAAILSRGRWDIVYSLDTSQLLWHIRTWGTARQTALMVWTLVAVWWTEVCGLG